MGKVNYQNLKPFKKDDPRRHTRTKGDETFKTLLNKMLRGVVVFGLEGKKKKMTRRQALILQLLSDATDKRNTAGERSKANEIVQNRVEGKPAQPISAAPGANVTLSINSTEKEEL